MTMYSLKITRDETNGDFIFISPDDGFSEQRITVSSEQAVIIARHILNKTEDDE